MAISQLHFFIVMNIILTIYLFVNLFICFSFERLVPSEWYRHANHIKQNVRQVAKERIPCINYQSGGIEDNMEVEETNVEEIQIL
jgi:hypothetical protein